MITIVKFCQFFNTQHYKIHYFWCCNVWDPDITVVISNYSPNIIGYLPPAAFCFPCDLLAIIDLYCKTLTVDKWGLPKSSAVNLTYCQISLQEMHHYLLKYCGFWDIWTFNNWHVFFKIFFSGFFLLQPDGNLPSSQCIPAATCCRGNVTFLTFMVLNQLFQL